MLRQEPEQAVTYDFDERSFMRACHALWAYRAIGRRGNLVVGSGLFLLGGFLVYQGVPGFWGPAMLIGAGMIAALDVGRDRLWRAYYRKHPNYPGPITARVNEGGVSVESAKGVNSHSWAAFQCFVRTDHALFLIVDQRQFSVIPVDAFESPQAAAAFEDVLSRNLRRLPRRFL